MKLFIHGKKFPDGILKEKKWRAYINDVVEFIYEKEILKMLLNIDSEAFF